MPILVVCPACGTKLNAPASGAGKHVRCPKAGCGTLVPVPVPLAAEEVVEAAILPPPPPKPVRAAAVDDDDDDRPRRRRQDDDEDRPRRRRSRDDDDRPRRRRDRSGVHPGAVVAIVFGILLLVGGGGYGIYRLASKMPDGETGETGAGFGLLGKSRVPDGWKEYSYPNDQFRAHFPAEPIVQRQPGRDGGTDVGIYLSAQKTAQGQGTGVYLMVIHFPANTTASQREEWLQETPWRLGGNPDAITSSPRTVKWAGRDAKEYTLTNVGGRRGATGGAIVRTMLTDTSAYTAMVGTDNGRATPVEEAAFFDNFVLLK